MNTPPTTAQPLDHFESALLTELREHVAAHPVHETATAPVTHQRHRGRWAAGLAMAAAAATAFVVASPGGPATSPAYAVEQTGDGEVVVTIHRLEDSSGLEQALREHGIDADVSYDPASRDGGHTSMTPDGEVEAPPPGERGTTERKADSGGEGPQLDQSGPGVVTEAEPAEPGEGFDPAGCGTGEPATLSQDGADWVLRIPADSPLQDRAVRITTGVDGDLMVEYPGDAPNSYCGVASVG
jgi:hypothetical protein